MTWSTQAVHVDIYLTGCARQCQRCFPAAPDQATQQQLELINDLILWQALMRVVCNVLRVHNGVAWANATIQTLNEDHVALFCRNSMPASPLALGPRHGS